MRNRFVQLLLIAAVLSGIPSCTTVPMSATYSQAMFQGKGYLDREEYDRALASFEKAAAEEPDGGSLSCAATAAYKAGHLAKAAQYIKRADRLPRKGAFGLRIAGYKALVLLAEKKHSEGMEALQDYIGLYRRLNPRDTIVKEEEMVRSDKVEQALLEVLVDDQATAYEKEMGQWTGPAGTGNSSS